MIYFFENPSKKFYAVQVENALSIEDIQKLNWLFGNAKHLEQQLIERSFIGPRATMITPWSTNAVEITQNMGIHGIVRIEEFFEANQQEFDPMLSQVFDSLNQDIFTIDIQPEPILYIEDIAKYNQEEGLALNEEEIAYLEDLAQKIGRKLTDSEVFGFSQVN